MLRVGRPLIEWNECFNLKISTWKCKISQSMVLDAARAFSSKKGIKFYSKTNLNGDARVGDWDSEIRRLKFRENPRKSWMYLWLSGSARPKGSERFATFKAFSGSGRMLIFGRETHKKVEREKFERSSRRTHKALEPLKVWVLDVEVFLSKRLSQRKFLSESESERSKSEILSFMNMIITRNVIHI